MVRTMLLSLDPGDVNVEIAGFEIIEYQQLPHFPNCLLSMAPDCVHQSSLDCSSSSSAVQRKVVFHTKHRAVDAVRVDWAALSPEQDRAFLSRHLLVPAA